MNKAKRRYQVLLHRCLAYKQISQNEFLLLTQMTEDEINLWFSPDVRDIYSTVEILGKIAEYQIAKQMSFITKICTLRQELGQELALWANTLALESSDISVKCLELGLLVIKIKDQRQAAVWALRLNVVLPQASLSVKSSCRVKNLISFVSNRDICAL